MSTKSKLLTALSVILVSAFVVTSLINYTVTREAVREELLNSSLPLTGKNIYSEIYSAMMRPILVSSSMANDAFLKDWVTQGEMDDKKLIKYLVAIKNKYDFATTFFVSHVTDRYYYQNGVLKKVNPRDAHDVWYYAFIRKKAEYDLDVDTNEAANNRLTIFINNRVENEDGRLLGVTGVGVKMDHATALLESARKTYGRNVYLVDRDGLVQVHSDLKRVEKFDITKAGGIRDIAKTILNNGEKPISLEYQWEGQNILLSTQFIKELGWHLIVEQNEESALITARNNLIRTLGVGLGASFLIVALCFLTINHYQARLERLAKTDPLTGAANRRALEERFMQASYKSKRYGDKFSVIIIDLDGFKGINDKLGHLAGDIVLKSVATIINETIRPSDFLARWGGDEFIILMDGIAADACSLVERLKENMDKADFETSISFSSGVAQLKETDDLGNVTRRADTAMYRAKTNGGDCIEII